MDINPLLASGASVTLLIVAIAFYVGTIALALWIGYLIMRAAVKNGTIQAHEELASRAALAAANAVSRSASPTLERRNRDTARTSGERALRDMQSR